MLPRDYICDSHNYYQNRSNKKMVLVTTDVLKVLSKEESLELLRIVALTKPDTASANIIKTETNTKLTRKQYYSRLSSLRKSRLDKKETRKIRSNCIW
jgi:hypothetical protein